MKKYIIPGILLLGMLTHAYGQQRSYTLTTPDTQSREYIARDYVVFGPGYEFTAEAGRTMQARIDRTMLFPPTENSYLRPDGTTTSDSTQGAAVGAINGALDVSPTGAATYTVPVEVPAGVAGIQPSLSLIYNSQAGNGIAGWGFNIGGLSAITRVPRTIFSDGAADGLKYSADDVYALDGNRLHAVSGSYGANGTEYRTETETFARIYSYGSLNGPERFEIHTKDGLIMRYGTGTGRLVYYENSVLHSVQAWQLDEVEYPNGQKIIYEYENFGLYSLIKRITYGGNSIEFSFETRQDLIPVRYARAKGNVDRILSKIVCRTGNEVHREYRLGYEYDTFSRLNQIALSNGAGESFEPTVFEWGKYAGTDIKVEDVNLTDRGSRNAVSDYSFLSVDVNGDGLTDLFEVFVEEVYDGRGGFFDVLARQQYTASKLVNGSVKFIYSNNNNYSIDIDSEFKGVLDLAENGQQNLVFAGTEISERPIEGGAIGNRDRETINSLVFSIFPQLSKLPNNNRTDTGFSRRLFTFAEECPIIAMGDVNNDGKSDIIYIERAKYNNRFPGEVIVFNLQDSIDVYNNRNGQTTKQLKISDNIAFSFNLSVAPERLYLADFDGDGMQDLFVLTTIGYHIFYNNGGSDFSTMFSDSNSISGTSFRHIKGPSSLNINGKNYPGDSKGKNLIQIGDYNGDGLPDFVVNVGNNDWRLFEGFGRGFNETRLTNFNIEGIIEETFTSLNNNRDQIFPIDFDGDGRTDLIISDSKYDVHIPFPNSSSTLISSNFKEHNIFWFRSTGTGFERVKKVTHNNGDIFSKHFVAGDFNGDGMGDIMYNLLNSNDRTNKWQLYTNQDFNAQSGRITGIANGFKQETKIEYSTLTDNTVYNRSRPDDVSYPVVEIQQSVPVVKSVTSNPQTDAQQLISYNYKGAKVHTQGRGFLGFGEISIHNNILDSKTTITYDYDENYFSPFVKKQTVEVGETIVSETEFTNTVHAFSPTHFLPYVSKTIEKDLLTGVTRTTEAEVDTNGNTTRQAVDISGEVRTTTDYTFIYAKGNGITPNRVDSVTTTSTTSDGSHTRKKTFEYDSSSGYLIKETVDPNDTNQVITEYKDFNTFGQPQRVETTANGIIRTSAVTYTPSGRFVKTRTNHLGETVTYNYDETKGLLLNQTDRLGTTSYDYDNWGRLHLTTYPDGVKSTKVLQWAVNSNLPNARYYSYSESSGQAPVTVWHDNLGRELRTETYGLNNRKIWVDTEYNSKGQVYRVSEPYFENGNKTYAATYIYDIYGRPQTVTTPMGQTAYSYSGLTTGVTTPEGTRATTASAAGWVVSEIINDKPVTFTHYANGKVKTATPEGGQSLTIEYDLQGNRTKLTDPDAGVVESKYNGFGELLWSKQKVHNNDWITTTNNYKPNGLIDNVLRNGKTTAYSYDSNFRLTNITNAEYKQTFTYDDFDRITNVKEEIDGKAYDTGTVYDDLGRVVREVYPSGYYAVNHYDTNGLLIAVSDQAGRQIWQAEEENARGQLTREKRGGMITEHSYNDNGQLTGTQNSVFNWSYAYTGKGNLDRRTDNRTGQREQFQYDELNRLTNWDIYQGNTLIKANDISYGAMGNITAKSDLGSLTMNYGENGKPPHALTSIDGVPSIFPTEDLVVTYTDFKKIKTLREGNKVYEITYGVDEQRRKSVYKENSVAKETRYYLGNYEEKTDHTTGITEKIHYISGAIYIIRSNGSNNLYYAYTDNIGSLISLVNEDGTVAERYAYDPWGLRRNPDNWTQSDSRTSWLVNRGYTGHEHLDKFQIINMNGRVYDPLTAMFFSPDPFVQAPGSWLNYNRYSYCYNNPFKYTDPSGEFIHIIAAAVFMGWVNIAMGISNGNIHSSMGALHAFAVGAISTGLSAGAASGVGAAFQALGNFAGPFGTEAIRGITHGLMQGGLTSSQGGDFWTGFASGTLSSWTGSGYRGLGLNEKLGAAGMIGFGALSGGIGAAATGGEFWQGAATGAIVTWLNHNEHEDIANKQQIKRQEALNWLQRMSAGGVSVLDYAIESNLLQTTPAVRNTVKVGGPALDIPPFINATRSWWSGAMSNSMYTYEMGKIAAPYATSAIVQGAVGGSAGGPAGAFAGIMVGGTIQLGDFFLTTFSQWNVQFSQWRRDLPMRYPFYY